MTDNPSGLYHAEVRLPNGYRHPRFSVNVEYSNHARREAASDRYGRIVLDPFVDLSFFETVEVEITAGTVSKIVVREAGHVERQRVLVLIPRKGQRWFCKTVWINVRSDSHKTLDRSRYVQ